MRTLIRISFCWGLIALYAWTESALVALLIKDLAYKIVDLPKAVSVVNAFDGISAIFMLPFSYLSEMYLGPYLGVVASTSSYISGLWLFYVGAVSGSKSEEKKLIYTAMVLLALGRTGFKVQFKAFLDDQCRRRGHPDDEEQAVQKRRNIYWRLSYIAGTIASLSVLTKNSLKDLCKNFAIAMSIAFAFFLLGTLFYERRIPAKSMWLLRWLNNSAVEESSSSREEQVRTGPMEQVLAEIKQLLRSLSSFLPLWIPFLAYGLLLATANTFFYLQTDYTANYFGPISSFTNGQSRCSDLNKRSRVVPVVFVLIRYFSCFVVSYLCYYLLSRRYGEIIPRSIMLIRMGIGLGLSPLCCIVAWKVEEYRVDERLNNAVCIRFLWLIPQFVLLGLVEGIVYDALESFYSSVVPESLRKYGLPFTEVALNTGHFVGMLVILYFRKYFNDNLDLSKLGRYYTIIGWACLGGFVVYCLVAKYKYYGNQEQGHAGTGEDVEPQALEQLQSPGEEPAELVGVASELASD